MMPSFSLEEGCFGLVKFTYWMFGSSSSCTANRWAIHITKWRSNNKTWAIFVRKKWMYLGVSKKKLKPKTKLNWPYQDREFRSLYWTNQILFGHRLRLTESTKIPSKPYKPTKPDRETLIFHPSKSQQTPHPHHPPCHPGLLVVASPSPASSCLCVLTKPAPPSPSAQQESPQHHRVVLAPSPRTTPPLYSLPPTPLQSSTLTSFLAHAGSGASTPTMATYSWPLLNLSVHSCTYRRLLLDSNNDDTSSRHPLPSSSFLDLGTRWRWRRSRRAHAIVGGWLRGYRRRLQPGLPSPHPLWFFLFWIIFLWFS